MGTGGHRQAAGQHGGIGESKVETLTRQGMHDMRGIGDKATDRVWEGAHGLEWEVPSPAPYHTFDTPPVVK